MITQLSIKNYALIDDVKVSFHKGLTIITGETGAGKSIMLGALSLLLGKRADLSSVKDTAKKCIIEADFNLQQPHIKSVFNALDIDFENHTIIRRELLPSGKSRSFVNDTPVTLQQLQGIAPYLVDVHSQHETLTLSSEQFQMEIVDIIAGNNTLLQSYKSELEVYKKASEDVAALYYKKESIAKEIDYNTFLYNELQEANLAHKNLEALEEQYATLNNSEQITEILQRLLQLASNEPVGAVETTKEMRQSLSKIKHFSPAFETLWERINSIVIELEDIEEELVRSAENVEADPQTLFDLNETLQSIYKLQQKHQVQTIEELLEIEEQLATKIDVTGSLEGAIETLEATKKQSEQKLQQLAQSLHNKRVEIIPTLTKKLEDVLKELGLPNAQFIFDFSIGTQFKNNGTDQLQLLFSANKGSTPGLLKKVASGGELSRIMLAIKAVLAGYKQLPTIVFDEIDTGVSGEIASKMATILQTMSASMQLVTITHLPQLASKGNHHLKVFKEDVGNKTVTSIKQLLKEERVTEIAQMIGGKTITDSAVAHAKQLLN